MGPERSDAVLAEPALGNEFLQLGLHLAKVDEELEGKVEASLENWIGRVGLGRGEGRVNKPGRAAEIFFFNCFFICLFELKGGDLGHLEI